MCTQRGDGRLVSFSVDTRRLQLRTSGLSWRTVGERVVVLDLDTSEYFALNPTGSLIWTAIERGATVAELVTAVMQEFEVSEDVAVRDIEAFLGALTSRKLLKS